jgi:hypothetical protein
MLLGYQWSDPLNLNRFSVGSVFSSLLLISLLIYRKIFNFLRISSAERFDNLHARKNSAPLFMEIFILCQRQCLLMRRILRKYE